MARRTQGESTSRSFRGTWAGLLAGLLLTVLGLALSESSWTTAQLLLIGGGALITGISVKNHLQVKPSQRRPPPSGGTTQEDAVFEDANWELEGRLESAGVLLLAGFVALLAYLGMDSRWDSGRLFFGVLVGISLGGAVLVLLPTVLRRLVLLLLVVIHFGGMFTTITSVDPPGGQAPWVSMQLWRFYRPYLTMMYLSNAYHFYSPDPGPPTLLRFYVVFEDDTYQVIQVPDKERSPVRIHYQRMLALTESTNHKIQRTPLTRTLQYAYLTLKMDQVMRESPNAGSRAQIQKNLMEEYPELNPQYSWDAILHRRNKVSAPHVDPRTRIPSQQELQLIGRSLQMQYQRPQEMSKEYISSYVRHLSGLVLHSEDPTIPIKYVQVYRIKRALITPAELVEGGDPRASTRMIPYFMGKFDPSGTLQDPLDPLLYWHIPIVVVHKNYPATPGLMLVLDPPPEGKVWNALKFHSPEVIQAEEESITP